MKLIYLAQIGLFDDWAHTVQIMKMCEAFAQNGADVELVIPRRKLLKSDDPFAYYNIQPIFKITRVPMLDLFYGSPNPLLYWTRFISFLLSARVYLLASHYDVAYTRELYAAPFFRNVWIERHSFPKLVNDLHHFIFRTSFGLVVLTSFIKQKLVGLGVNPDKILVAPDAVRLEDFEAGKTMAEARAELRITGADVLFGYVGTLKTMGMEKGVAAAIDSLQHLSPRYKLYVVGGEPVDLEFYKRHAAEKGLRNRVIFAGKVPHKDIPIHIAACDIVVAPFPENEHYGYYMSPLKIFEYMAAGRPIAASNLPSLREVLHDGTTAILIRPGDAEALAEAVRRLDSDHALADRLANNARAEVEEKYTWKKRAAAILEAIRERAS
jgi:glycosyltransferase involved in cell wall biosynthesis